MTSQHSTTPGSMSDVPVGLSKVVALCQSGELQARRQLYELCSQRVFRLMVHMVGLQDASDLTQQVFLQVFLKIDQFAGQSKFETWMYRLAVNEALQHLRKEGRRKVQPLTHEPTSQHVRMGERMEQEELLEQALAQANPELRSIFLLREVEELTYQEIATVLEIPEGTVGSRLNRARQELRQILTDLGWKT